MKTAIGMTIIFGLIVSFIYNTVPRLVSDLWHARDFVPARHFAITDYKCTNWNGFMWNECTTTFMSQQSGESRQFTDWRFGRAPRDPVRLMQWRDDASAVTTNVSLQTLWNRLLLAVSFLSFFGLVTITLVVKAFKPDDVPIDTPSDAPIGALSGESAPQPAGRSTFGKRPA